MTIQLDKAKPLSKEAEEKIVSALQKVVDLTDNGMDPNSAIVKIAQDDKIPDGYVRLMVYAYNTGQQTAQRKSAQDRARKAEEIPLANVEAIFSTLYPSHVKSAAEIFTETCVSDDYSQAPIWTLERDRQEKIASKNFIYSEDLDKLQKQAAAKVKEQPKGRQDDATKIFSDIQRLKTACEQSYSKVARLHDAVSATIDKLDNYFRKTTSRPFNEVFDNATLMFGKEAVALKETLLEKNAALAKDKRIPDFNRPAVGEAYDLVSKCIKTASDFFSARDEFFNTLDKSEEERKKILKPLDALLPKIEKASGCVMEETEKEASCVDKGMFRLPFFPLSKEALWGMPIGQTAKVTATGNIMRAMSDTLKPQGFGNESSPPLISPSHASELRNVHLESMLSDLLANDPIIQGYHRPDEVLNAFNEISEMAPRAASNKVVARAFLRKYLTQGQLADYDLTSLADIEKRLSETGDPGVVKPTGSPLPKPVASGARP